MCRTDAFGVLELELRKKIMTDTEKAGFFGVITKPIEKELRAVRGRVRAKIDRAFLGQDYEVSKEFLYGLMIPIIEQWTSLTDEVKLRVLESDFSDDEGNYRRERWQKIIFILERALVEMNEFIRTTHGRRMTNQDVDRFKTILVANTILRGRYDKDDSVITALHDLKHWIGKKPSLNETKEVQYISELKQRLTELLLAFYSISSSITTYGDDGKDILFNTNHYGNSVKRTVADFN